VLIERVVAAIVAAVAVCGAAQQQLSSGDDVAVAVCGAARQQLSSGDDARLAAPCVPRTLEGTGDQIPGGEGVACEPHHAFCDERACQRPAARDERLNAPRVPLTAPRSDHAEHARGLGGLVVLRRRGR